MEFYSIKNNTSNPVIINGNYIGINSEIIIDEDFLDKIDKKYFEANILINIGMVEVSNPIYIDPPTTVTTVVKERNLEKSVRDTLIKAKQTYDVIQNKIGYSELKPAIQNILDSISDTAFKTYWKDPVENEFLLPSVDTNLNSDGDIRLVLDSNIFYRWNDTEKRWVEIFTNGNQSPTPSDYGSPISIVKERFILDEFFAREGQQIFNLRSKYSMNTNDLQVILNGILLSKDIDYLEINDRTVEILFPLRFEDYLVFTVSGQDNIPYVIVEKHVLDSVKNTVILNQSIGTNPSIIQVFLNGISVSFGENHDYIVKDSKTLVFNYNLEVNDIVLVRFEHSSLSDNFENKFAQMQRVYMDLSKKVQYLREVLESRSNL